MSCNPLRDLQQLARDVRMIGWARIPINIERACMIFLNTNAYGNNASYFSAIRIAKLARWANCEVYFISNPSVPEFQDALEHFATQTLNFCLFYLAGNPISQDIEVPMPEYKLPGGNISPESVYEVLNQKQPDVRIVWMMDGCNKPEAWDPKAHHLSEPGVLYITAYPDDRQAHLQQFDLKDESIFIQAVYTALKGKPTIKAAELVRTVDKEIHEFGQKVYCSSDPDEFRTELAMIV